MGEIQAGQAWLYDYAESGLSGNLLLEYRLKEAISSFVSSVLIRYLLTWSCKHLEKWLSLKPAKSFLDHPFFFLNIWSLEQTCWRKFFYCHLQNEWWSDFFPHVEIFSLTTRMEGMKFIFIFIVMLLTSRSNWESGASPASMPPPDDSELSDGDVMVCRLEL